ncbi:MAG: hypothetical protein EPN91_02390 [Salinibacterium sp.]|nr:MAG: hypothetical protein EPN91_02390 [Salinibacterium sp.]
MLLLTRLEFKSRTANIVRYLRFKDLDARRDAEKDVEAGLRLLAKDLVGFEEEEPVKTPTARRVAKPGDDDYVSRKSSRKPEPPAGPQGSLFEDV